MTRYEITPQLQLKELAQPHTLARGREQHFG